MSLNYAKGTEHEKLKLIGLADTAGYQRGSAAGWFCAVGDLAPEPVWPGRLGDLDGCRAGRCLRYRWIADILKSHGPAGEE